MRKVEWSQPPRIHSLLAGSGAGRVTVFDYSDAKYFPLGMNRRGLNIARYRAPQLALLPQRSTTDVTLPLWPLAPGFDEFG